MICLLAVITPGTASRAHAAPWIQHVGLSEQEYEDFIDFGLPPGFFPISISVNGSTSNTRFGVIAVQFTAAVAVEARHGLSSDEYQDEFDALDALGFRLLAVDAVGEHPNERYAAIWINDGLDSDWYARHGITSDELQEEFDTQLANSMRMI